MLSIETSHIYKKGYRRAAKRGLPMEKLNEVVQALANQESLPAKEERDSYPIVLCGVHRSVYSG